MSARIKYVVVFLLLSCGVSFSQNEGKVWYFGSYAGLDFNTSPPTILTNGALTTDEGCASISNSFGNLLFYTNGATVYDRTHVVMANGTGLLGHSSTSQAAIIVKKPGSSTLYYVFTLGAGGAGSLYYSEVDMTLAAGLGSVTVKNTQLATGMTEHLTSVKHCNGTDIWVLAHNGGTNIFRAFLVTSGGVNPTSVNSMIGTNPAGTIGCMKVSPNGKKLGFASIQGNLIEVFDFDASTGLITNPLTLGVNITLPYGVEFSPDGTKFYVRGSNVLAQWDLCAGSNFLIAASQNTFVTVNGFGGAQLAPDGKIYVARGLQPALGVVNNPNVAGFGCNYVDVGQSVAPKSSLYGLPNFIPSGFKPPPPPYTHTVSNSFGCQTAAFTAPAVVQNFTTVSCATSGYSLMGLQWNFSDPASGANNTSTLSNPVHAFTAMGTYSVNLILYYSCGGGTDTIKGLVNINQPCISVSSTSITCANLGSATVHATGGIGPFSYTWMPSAQANSVATGLIPGTYTLTVFDFGNNFTYTATTVFTSLIPLTGNVNNASSVTCNGASTATANVTNIAGGSGTVTYVWQNPGGTVYTSPTPSLGAGIWSVTVNDVLTGCQIKQSMFITQPPPLNLVLASNVPTICAAKTASLNGTNSGGTPYLTGSPYTYTWSGGPTSNTHTVNQVLPGIYIYTLSSQDSLTCLTSNTIALDFVANPTLSVSDVSICPLQTGTLNVSGATTYTWSDNTTSSFLTDNPLISEQYTVTGTALGCTAVATASIILKPVPTAVLNSNSPICNGQNLNLFGNGGASYAWQGPLGYNSSVQNPVLSIANPANSGVYGLTVTAANSCTASTTKTLTIHPTPTISLQGDTVCTNQTFYLSSSSFPGASYLWTGPNGFSSAMQNPSLNNPGVGYAGTYTLKVTSTAGCTNNAVTNVSITALPIPTITSNGPLCFGKDLYFAGSNGAESWSWSGPNGFVSSVQNPSIGVVDLLAKGIYNLQITLGPCVNNTTHSVNVFPLPSFTVSSNTNVCETKKLNLYGGTVSNAVSYLWQGPGFSSPMQSTSRDSSKFAHSGTYTLTVTDANTCVNRQTVFVTILQNPILTPVSTTVCLNEPATLKVSGAVSYLWSGPGFYQSNLADAFVPSATSPVTTIYTVTGTAANSCTSIVTASLETLPLPVPSLNVFPGKRLCFSKPFSLEGFGGLFYEWYAPDNVRYTTKSLSLTANSPVYAGIYTLVVIDGNNCRNKTSLDLTIDPLPGGSLQGQMEGCVPFGSNFYYYSANASSPDIITDWQISGGGQFSAKNFSNTFSIPGDYLVTGIFTNTLTGCASTNTYMVYAHEVPVADFTFTPQRPLEGLEEVIFTNTSKGQELDKFNWYLISNEGPVSSNQHTNYLFEKTGVYPLAMVVTNKWGCADTSIKTIFVEPDYSMYIPNAFTPDGDDLNDTFKPVLNSVKLYNMKIFNRWGHLLFESIEPSRGWPGTFNGGNCKADVYVWKIELSTLSGEMKKLNGTVTLIR